MSVEARGQLAVALHYDKKGAPRVVAKGKGSIGEKIIEVAKAHDIPIEENEVLAGAHSPRSNSAMKFHRSFTRRSRKCWSSCCGCRGEFASRFSACHCFTTMSSASSSRSA
jgi:hypothetical protein